MRILSWTYGRTHVMERESQTELEVYFTVERAVKKTSAPAAAGKAAESRIDAVNLRSSRRTFSAMLPAHGPLVAAVSLRFPICWGVALLAAESRVLHMLGSAWRTGKHPEACDVHNTDLTLAWNYTCRERTMSCSRSSHDPFNR